MQAAATRARLALVTGANKGIGYSVVQQLTQQDPLLTVLLGSRDKARGEEAVNKLGSPQVKLLVIDVNNEDSIATAAATVKNDYGGLDILVNNAGITFLGDEFDEGVARTTLGTNYFGVVNVCKHFMPLLRDNGRVVNVSSRLGKLNKITSLPLREKFLSPDLTIPQLTELMNKFIADVAAGTYSQEGWPKTTYGVSKIGLGALTRILGRQEDNNPERKGVLVTSCCPGWCQTELGGQSLVGHKAFRTAGKGAEVVTWLSLLPAGDQGKQGKFFADNQEIDYVEGEAKSSI